MSKGSRQRRRQVSAQEFSTRWSQTFGGSGSYVVRESKKPKKDVQRDSSSDPSES